MQHEKTEFGLGIIGMGGFGLFAAQHFLQIPNTRIIAIAGTNREGTKAAAARFGAEHLDTLEALVNHPEVNIVYIATPPFLHHQQALLALHAGKHVICEKPLAVTAEQGHELIDLARSKNLMMITNLMQRYNPMFERVRQLINKKLLGEPLHGYFENYAADEGLNADHWFWDKEKVVAFLLSTVFISLTFLKAGLVKGKLLLPKPLNALTPTFEDQVNCTVQYGPVTVNFYHGFYPTWTNGSAGDAYFIRTW